MEAARIDGAGVFFDILEYHSASYKAYCSINYYLDAHQFVECISLATFIYAGPKYAKLLRCFPQFFQGEFTNDQTKILAAAVMTIIPEIIVYLFMQKSFEKGMSAGALK